MGKSVLPTLRALSEVTKRERTEGGSRAKRPLETRKPGPKDMTREVSREGGGGSSLRVSGWWMLTMNSHGVEISTARCVREMVRDPNPMPFFFSFLFFLSCVHCFLGTRSFVQH